MSLNNPYMIPQKAYKLSLIKGTNERTIQALKSGAESSFNSLAVKLINGPKIHKNYGKVQSTWDF